MDSVTTGGIPRIHAWDLNDKYLRLKKRKIKKLITLPPKYLGNLSKGIENAIFKSNEETFKEFKGVPISMGKKALLQNVATSIDDHAFLQFFVELDCVVFTPKVDKKVRAVVNKIGETYVGCLICERINASIFINESNEIESQDKPKELTIGQEILIKINSIKYEQNNDLFIVASFVKSF